MQATTTDDIHTILEENNLSKKVYKSIQDKILYNLNYRLSNKIAIEFIIFSNQNGVLIKSENAQNVITSYSIHYTKLYDPYFLYFFIE